MKKFLLSILFAIVTTFTYSQIEDSHRKSEDRHIESHREHEEKYKIALTLGVTHIPAAFEHGNQEDAVFVPTIGIDFFYKIKHNWSLGIMTDLEIGDYIVDFNRENLNRENALIITLMAGYEILPSWELLFGGGIEIETNNNLAVLRIGSEYEFQLTNNWHIAPSFFYDFKEEYNTYAIAIGVSKKF